MIVGLNGRAGFSYSLAVRTVWGGVKPGRLAHASLLLSRDDALEKISMDPSDRGRGALPRPCAASVVLSAVACDRQGVEHGACEGRGIPDGGKPAHPGLVDDFGRAGLTIGRHEGQADRLSLDQG